ncbi:hypothetical protein F5X99DRAFT_381843 [Biscogniauxia marginata]|nr:hypothetical protein F5X99DRAFT_381843 [Biscogniauxia marginata]
MRLGCICAFLPHLYRTSPLIGTLSLGFRSLPNFMQAYGRGCTAIFLQFHLVARPDALVFPSHAQKRGWESEKGNASGYLVP